MFSTLIQPIITPTLTNGRISAVSIVDGGTGWIPNNIQGREPELIVTPPLVETGKQATLKAEFTNGVLTAVKVDNGGSGYSTENLPTFAVKNDEKRESVVVKHMAGVKEWRGDSETIIDSLPTGEGIPSVTAEERTSMVENIEKTPEEFKYKVPDDTFRVKEDPNRNRVSTLPQARFTAGATQPYRDATVHTNDYKYLNDIDIPRANKDLWINDREREIAEREKNVDDITQDVAIKYDVRNEMLVQTVQGPTSELPHASEYTKYMLRQYRPDPKRKTTINVALSCSPVTAGCTHFSCTAPAAQTGSSSTDPETGITTTTTYTMSGLMGEGCKAWTANGKFDMYNDLTASALQVAQASAAYGNPYSQ